MSDSRPCRSEFRSRPITKEYAEGYDRAFKKKPLPKKEEAIEELYKQHLEGWDNEGGQ